MGATRKGERLIDKASASNLTPEQAVAQYVARLNAEYGGSADRDRRCSGNGRWRDGQDDSHRTSLQVKERRREVDRQMAVFYLDASALLKRYRTEKGTEIVDDIYDGRGEQHIILTSQLTCIEVESVAARARKGGILNDQRVQDAPRRLQPGPGRRPSTRDDWSRAGLSRRPRLCVRFRYEVSMRFITRSFGG